MAAQHAKHALWCWWNDRRNPGPNHMTKALDTETRYRLLKLLEENPNISQRALAAELGLSLGKTNYCLKALIDRGWVKMVNFTRSDNKRAYLYKLTPSGIGAKARAARKFLARKIKDHERITTEIDMLRSEVLDTDGIPLSDETT